MKIGLCLAFNKGVNYGMQLQAFATQQLLKKMGYDTEVIDYTRNSYKHVRLTPFLLVSLVNQKVAAKKNKADSPLTEVHLQNIKLRKEEAKKFVDEHFENVTKCIGITQLEQLALTYDSVIVGSDQQWGANAVFGNFVTLRFVPEQINKISYATSLGVSEYPYYAKGSARQFLNRIDHISVREEQGKKVVTELCKKPVEVVLDPTYMLSKSEWEQLLPKESLIQEKYILAYFLGDNKGHKLAAKEYAAKHGYLLVSILSTESVSELDLTFADRVVYGKGPEYFVNLIRYAECVFTDSFHGIAFSVINNVPFYAFYRTKVGSKGSRNSRIDDILAQWNLTDRLIGERDVEKDIIDSTIDYDNVNARIEKRRKESLVFLQTALDDPRYKGE